MCIECGAILGAHDFAGPYEWFNTTYHYATCVCGETKLQGHAVRIGSSICLLCGGLANRGVIEITMLSVEPTYYTYNGSVVFPDGLIVLADDDIESFFNGSLYFVKKNEEFEIK